MPARDRLTGALVLGGTGAVGRHVVRRLAAAGQPVVFTYHRAADAARALADETGARAVGPLDLSTPGPLREAFAQLDPAPQLLVHCAAVARPAPLPEVTDADWSQVLAINAQSALVACQELARALEGRPGRVVLLGGLDRAQSLPVPLAYAASQGALGALTMALGKELGPRGVLVNMLVTGPLDEGLSRDLDPELLAQYEAFSAMQRRGTAAEVADAAVWLATSNGYMNGKVVAVNGGV